MTSTESARLTVNGLSVVQGLSFLEVENDIKCHIDTVSGLSVVQGLSFLEGEMT